MANTLTVVARLTAAAGHAEEIQAALTRLVLAARAEKGCIRFVMKRGVDNPDLFVLIQEWRNRNAWEAHRNAPPITEFRDTLPEGALISHDTDALTTVA